MPRTAPSLLGRERETAELYDALAAAMRGTPQIVLVGGDAGIGKTTLVADLERRATELGVTAATGHCLDIEAGISFEPVVEAVRALVTGLEDLEDRPSARRMHNLLDPEAAHSPEPIRVLDDLRQTVLEAADAGPVMLVLEDMHWADRSTQDFATSLARTARGRLLVVLTVRSDDLHRRHPFRRTLAELCSVPGARRVDLDPLGRDSIAGIVATVPGAARSVRGFARCWPGRRATRCTPRSSRSPTRGRSQVTCPTCCSRGSTPSPRVRGTAPARLGRRDPCGHQHPRRAGAVRPTAAGRPPPRTTRREPPAEHGRLSGVPARPAA